MYVPSHTPYDYYTKQYEKGLQLYSSGVMIMDNCEELVPEHFRFVRGVVDSQDLSLNISREMLQHNRQVSIMARNICDGLARQYPACKPLFEENLLRLESELTQLQQYGEDALSALPCREIITFHDGFQYFAQAFGLSILEAVEEESGSEASAAELIRLVTLVREHSLPAVFTEVSGSVSAAGVISRETGCRSFPLDMAMAGGSYFDAMYRNIDTVKEALQ